MAGEPGPVPRKEIRRSLVILEQDSDQSQSPVELNGRLRRAPVVKRMGGLVAGRFVATACDEAVRKPSVLAVVSALGNRGDYPDGINKHTSDERRFIFC